MPTGIVKWFDPHRGKGAIEHLGKEYPVSRADMEPRTRVTGARVRFDRRRDDGVIRAENVRRRSGRRTSKRQHRFGDLTGAHLAEQKGTPAQTRGRRRQALRRPSEHPVDVVEQWVAAVAANDLDRALRLYAPEAVLIDRDAGRASGPRAARRWLDAAPFLGTSAGRADIRSRGRRILVTWPVKGGTDAFLAFRLEHGRIVEQVTMPATPRAQEGDLP